MHVHAEQQVLEDLVVAAAVAVGLHQVALANTSGLNRIAVAKHARERGAGVPPNARRLHTWGLGFWRVGFRV